MRGGDPPGPWEGSICTPSGEAPGHEEGFRAPPWRMGGPSASCYAMFLVTALLRPSRETGPRAPAHVASVHTASPACSTRVTHMYGLRPCGLGSWDPQLRGWRWSLWCPHTWPWSTWHRLTWPPLTRPPSRVEDTSLLSSVRGGGICPSPGSAMGTTSLALDCRA